MSALKPYEPASTHWDTERERDVDMQLDAEAREKDSGQRLYVYGTEVLRDENEGLRRQVELRGDIIEGLRQSLDETIAERNELQARLDGMEQTHMPLPVDADGVPIRPGDTLVRGKDMPSFKVLSIDYNDNGVRVFNENSFGITPCEYRHAKPDHVKELLKELMGETVEWCHYSGPMSGTRTQGEIVTDYAERIRKAVHDGD